MYNRNYFVEADDIITADNKIDIDVFTRINVWYVKVDHSRWLCQIWRTAGRDLGTGISGGDRNKSQSRQTAWNPV